MDIFGPVRETLVILAAVGGLYLGVMLWLRPWRAANRDDSTPIWKFLFLGFGYKLRRYEGLAGISWALLISGAVGAWGYFQYAQLWMVLDPDGPYARLAGPLMTSTDELVDIPLNVEAGTACRVVQLGGVGALPRCTLVTIDGQIALRLHGFDLTCEVTCPGDGGWNRFWEYSRGPLPLGIATTPEGQEI